MATSTTTEMTISEFASILDVLFGCGWRRFYVAGVAR